MAVTITETWDTRVTTTMFVFLKKKSVDQIFSGNLLLGTLLGHSSRVNKDRGPFPFQLKSKRVYRQAGGRDVRIPLRYKRSSNTTSFRHTDRVPVNLDNIHTICYAPWSYYTDAAVVSWQEDIENQGEAQILKMVQERTENALDTIKEQVDTDLGATGDAISVGNQGRNIIGLQHLFGSDPTTGTVWGVDRSIYPWWRHNKVEPDGGADSFANKGVETLAKAMTIQSGTSGEDPPTYYLTTSQQWRALHAVIQMLQQVEVIVPVQGGVGFRALHFMDTPVFYGGGTPDYSWYSLNMNYMVACLNTAAQFAIKYQGQGGPDQVLSGIWRILFGAQLGCERMDRQALVVFNG